MTQNKIAISIINLGKQYQIGAIGGKTLQEDLQSYIAKKRGKQDPNLKIGISPDVIGQKFWALKNININIYQGERIGIIGANGAGKSTLLKIISRITAPTTGDIDLYGRVSSMLEVGTGFHGEMTGRENIYMNGAILGMSSSQIDERIEDIIEFSEIREFIDTPVKRYSSGMFVKLAFAVAAFLKSEIIIMDEVLAVGDMAFQEKCLKKMRESATQDGKTVLYVSHNMNTIRNLCERCIVLQKGEIIYDGDVETAISKYMANSLENSVDIDLTNTPRDGFNIDTGLSMKHINLIDKVTPIYDNKENLLLNIKLNITKSLKNVQCRITFKNNTNESIATALSKPINLKPKNDIQFFYSIPLNNFVKGKLYCCIGFYTESDLGNLQAFDYVDQAFMIEIRPSIYNRFHNLRNLGYIQIENTKCKVLK